MSADTHTRRTGRSRPKVVVIGGGFAGIAVVRELRDSEADVTIVDRNNHHLFQPFLFQVATVHDAFLGVVAAVGQGAGLPQHRVDQGGFAVVDVGDDGDVAEWHVGDCGSGALR